MRYAELGNVTAQPLKHYAFSEITLRKVGHCIAIFNVKAGTANA
jgi:hypothetical protein